MHKGGGGLNVVENKEEKIESIGEGQERKAENGDGRGKEGLN